MHLSNHPDIEHGTNRYVSYYKGDKDSPIIITVPHGGAVSPSEIIDRNIVLSNNKHLNNTLKITTEGDCRTMELACILYSNIALITNKRPHMIVCNIRRKKVDLNRPILEATLNNENAITAFNEFHGFINEAKKSIKPRGILFDIHGQSHPEKWVELGYCMNLKNGEEFNKDISSIKGLANNSSSSFEDLIYGDKSLGYQLQERKIKTVPSPTYKTPNGGNYYSGGYNSKTHGSKCGGHIDAIQVESPGFLRKPEHIVSYAENLAAAIVSFVELHY